MDAALFDAAARQALVGRIRYVGSGHHKRNPADYGLERTNPRPTKSLCDAVTPILLQEASELLRQGVLHAMFSSPAQDGLPKYIWCVSASGVVFEAKTHPNTPGVYHGYPLEAEDDVRAYVLDFWRQRCKTTGN